MTKPEAVVFDLGKVLLEFDYSIAVRRLAEKSTCGLPEIHRRLTQTPLLFDYETGLLTTQEFFEQMCHGMGYVGGLEEFRLLFGDIFSPIPEMITFQSELKTAGVPTFIFSNTNELAILHIRKKFPFFNGFDDYVLSYEHGSMKPDSKIYEAVERVTHRKGCQLLYIDDRPENIETGITRGWHCICQETPAKTLPLAKQLLGLA